MKKYIYIHICTPELLCCTAEIDTILQINYASIKHTIKSEGHIFKEFPPVGKKKSMVYIQSISHTATTFSKIYALRKSFPSVQQSG